MSNRCYDAAVSSQQSSGCYAACLGSQLDKAILPLRQLVVPEGVHLLGEWAAWLV